MSDPASTFGGPSPELLARALECCRTDRLAEGEELFRRLFRDHPDHVEFLRSLVAIARTTGRLGEVLGIAREAVLRHPEQVEVHLVLGALLLQLDRAAEAIGAYRGAVALAPGRDEAHDGLAMALLQMGRGSEACVSFARFVELRPKCAQGHMNLGAALHQLGRLEEAVVSYRRVLVLEPTHAGAHGNLGSALYQLDRNGQHDRAVELAGEWRRDFPASPWACHLGAAICGTKVPERASDEYLRAEFDGSAAVFERHLAALGYCAPRLLVEALRPELGLPARRLEVLDVGCGPGTCGPHLRPYARRLVGLDLAPLMLDQARAHGPYDRLVVGEMGEFLRAHAGEYDLIVGADVLPYSGRLDGVFLAAASALRAGGTCAFTAEDDTRPADYRLNPSGRYSHRGAYLQRVVAGAGLSLLRLFVGAGRTEDKETTGFSYLLARKA